MSPLGLFSIVCCCRVLQKHSWVVQIYLILFPLSSPSVVVKAKENHFFTFVKSPKLLPFLGAVKVDI